MRSRTLLAPIFVVCSFALPLAAHAAIPFFGPIIPVAYNVCPASFGLLITVINNVISLLITLAIVFVAPLMIAYAGFLFVVNPVNPAGKEKAKDVLRNTIVGIVIALSGWLIVAAIMAVLYNPTAQSGTTTLDVWSSLITGNLNDACLKQAGALPGAGLNQVPQTGVSATGALNLPSSARQTGSACDPAAVQAGAAAGGKNTLSTTQANIFACIARPESTCGSVNLNYNWNKGSSAAGPFQVLLSTNSNCYENAACYKVAGVTNGTLNCASGFSGGNPIPSQSAKVDQCTKAASDLNCSASAAACLLAQNGGSFSPWQPKGNNAAQTACINSGGV